MCKRPAHIVILVSAAAYKLLKFRHNSVEAAVARIVNAPFIVNFFSAVEAQNDVMHLTVCKIYNVVVYQHTVCCKSKAEIFAVLFFYAASVFNELFNRVPIHKRLSAEEIDLKIASRTRVFYKEVERALTRFKTHYGSVAVVFTLARKAI